MAIRVNGQNKTDIKHDHYSRREYAVFGVTLLRTRLYTDTAGNKLA